MLFCIMLLYIAVRSCFTVLKSIGTCRTADGTTLVVDSRRSAGRNGFQILSIHSFLIVMRRQFTIRCATGGADSLCSAGRSAAAMVLYFDFVVANTALFPVLVFVMLLYIAVRSFFTVLKSIGTCRTADGTTLVVDSRRSAGCGRFQILSFHNILIIMCSKITVLCVANRANGLCRAGRRAAAMGCFVSSCMADTTFIPMLFCIMLLYIAVRSLFAILKGFGTRRTADGATLVVDSRRSAGRSGFQVLLICKFLILMTGCFCDDRIFIRNLMLAVLIREALFAGGAFPIRRIAVFRAGRVLCGNSSQRVAD